MITADQLKRATKEIEAQTKVAECEMPNAEFVLDGIDSKYIYFSLVGKLSQITEQQKKNIVEKTRFFPLETIGKVIYNQKFKVKVYA